MKKGLNNVLIVLIIALFIIEIYNLALNIKYKSEIAKIIKIDNVKDFDIKKIVRGYGPETDSMFITFKISVDNYNTYSLNYYDSNIMYGSIQAISKDKDLGINGTADERRRGTYQVKY